MLTYTEAEGLTRSAVTARSRRVQRIKLGMLAAEYITVTSVRFAAALRRLQAPSGADLRTHENTPDARMPVFDSCLSVWTGSDPTKHAQAQNPNDDEVDRDDVVQQPRYHQDQNAGNQ